MAVTVTTLRTAHPEFNDTPDAVVSAAITSAQTRVDSTVLGSLYDEAVTWLACDLIATSPYGREKLARYVGEYTNYRAQYEDIIKTMGSAYRVIP